MQITYNAPDDECRLDNMLEAEYSHAQVGKHTRFYTQHAYNQCIHTIRCCRNCAV